MQVLSQLEQYTKYPDFNNYLAYIFADGENLSIEVRACFATYLPVTEGYLSTVHKVLNW